MRDLPPCPGMYLSIPFRTASSWVYLPEGECERALSPGAEILSDKGRPGMTALSKGLRERSPLPGRSVSRIGWPEVLSVVSTKIELRAQHHSHSLRQTVELLPLRPP